MSGNEYKPSEFWGRVDFFVKLGAVVLSLFGGTLALWSYYSNFLALRDQRSFEIVAIYERAETQKAVAALSSDIDSLLADLGPDATPVEIGDVLFDLYATGNFVEKRAQFTSILYLVRRLSYCHQKNRCNRDILEEYFCEFVSSFWQYFHLSVSLDMRSQGVDSVERFVASCVYSRTKTQTLN